MQHVLSAFDINISTCTANWGWYVPPIDVDLGDGLWFCLRHCVHTHSISIGLWFCLRHCVHIISCMYVYVYIYIYHIYTNFYTYMCIYIYICIYTYIYMEVSWNGSIPKSSILKRVFFHKQSIWGPHIYPLWYSIISVYYHMTPIIGRPMARSMTSSSMPVTWTGLSRFQWRTRPGDVLEKATIFWGISWGIYAISCGFLWI